MRSGQCEIMLSWYITILESHTSIYVEVRFVPHRKHGACIIKTSLLILCVDIIVTLSNNTDYEEYRQCSYNVQLWRVRATIAVVEKQSACATSSSVACLALQYFYTLSHKRHDFRQKKILKIK